MSHQSTECVHKDACHALPLSKGLQGCALQMEVMFGKQGMTGVTPHNLGVLLLRKTGNRQVGLRCLHAALYELRVSILAA